MLVNFRRKRSNAFLTLLLLLLLRLNSSPQPAHWNLRWLRIHSSDLWLSLPQYEQRMIFITWPKVNRTLCEKCHIDGASSGGGTMNR